MRTPGPLSDDPPGRASAAIRIGQGYHRLREIAFLDPGPGHGANGPGIIVLGIPHPGHGVAGHLADDATDVVEQDLFVRCLHHDLVAGADSPQLPVQPTQIRLRLSAGSDVDESHNNPCHFPLLIHDRIRIDQNPDIIRRGGTMYAKGRRPEAVDPLSPPG